MGACGGGGSSGTGSSPASSQPTTSTAPPHLTAAEWANEVCGSISRWADELQSAGSDLKSTLEDVTDAHEAKNKLVSFVDGAVGSTNTLIGDVEAAGAPLTPNGQAVYTDFLRGLQDARSSLVKAQSQAKQLPTDSLDNLGKKTKGIGSTLQGEGNDLSSSLGRAVDKDASPELAAAFKNDPDCKSVASGIGGSSTD